VRGAGGGGLSRRNRRGVGLAAAVHMEPRPWTIAHGPPVHPPGPAHEARPRHPLPGIGGEINVLQALRAFDPPPPLRQDYLSSLLACAAGAGRLELRVVAALLQPGADVSHAGPGAGAALACAADAGHIRVVCALIGASAGIEAVDVGGGRRSCARPGGGTGGPCASCPPSARSSRPNGGDGARRRA
jgi:hypothetical protein